MKNLKFVRPPKLVLGALAAMLALLSGAADDSQHWHWKYDTGESSADPAESSITWHDYNEVAAWTVGTTGLNPESRVPGASDIIYYGNYYHGINAFDMGGKAVTIYGIDDTYTRTHVSEQWGYHKIMVRNGSLTLGNCCTNTRTHFNVWGDGKVYLADSCQSCLGRSGASTHWYVHSGGYARIAGDITFNLFNVDVYDGGEVEVDASRFEHLDDANSSTFNNRGYLGFPNGLKLTGSISHGHVTTTQLGGTMTIGGDFSKAAAGYGAYLIFAGGTVEFTASSTLSGYSSAVISNSAPVTVSVATSKIADYRQFVLQTGSQLTKTGGGEFIVGSGSPTVVTVSEGVLGVAGELNFGSSLTLASGSTLRFYGSGASASSISGLSGATIDVSSSISDGTKVFTSTSDSLLSSVLAKLQASSSSMGEFSIVDDYIVLHRSHSASTFYWKGGFSTWKYFNEAANWGVGTDSSATNPNNLVPGATDKIHYMYDYSFSCFWDLGGLKHTVRGFDFTDWTTKGAQWGFHKFYLRNGTLEISESFTNQRVTVYLEKDAKFILGPKSATRLSQGDAQSWYTVCSGCEMVMGGKLAIVIPMVDVYAGGKCSFEPEELTATSDFKTGVNHPDAYLRNYGTMNFPRGFKYLSGGNQSSPGAFTIDSLGGVMTFDDALTKGSAAYGLFYFYFNGGTVNFNQSADLTWFASAGSTNAATTTVNVPSGKTLKLPGGSYVSGSKIIFAGGGAYCLEAGIPDSVEVTEGDLRLVGTAATVNSLKMASGATLTISGIGTTINNFDGYASVNFVVDVTSMGVGSVVLKSSNNAMLASLKERAVLPTGYYLTRSAGKLTLSNDSLGYVFKCQGEKQMDDPTGWTTGSVAPAGADVFVKGSTTTAVLDESMNIYNSITVLEGGTLKLKNLTTIPKLSLMYDSAVKFAAGDDFALPVGQIYSEADEDTIPVMEISAGAKVTFASATEFKNIDIRLYGELKCLPPFYFGTAEAGETSYFNFATTGGVIDVSTSVDSLKGRSIYWMTPKSSTGRVKSPRGISLRQLSFTYVSGSITSLFGNMFGYYSDAVQNPADEKFDVIVDKCDLITIYNGGNTFSAGARFKAVNGGTIGKPPKHVSAPGTYGHPYIRGEAELTFTGDGSWYGYYFDRYQVEAQPTLDSHAQMTFKSGASVRAPHFNGNGKAIYTFENGFWDVLELPGYDRAFWGGWVRVSANNYQKYTTGTTPGHDVPANAIIENADTWKYYSPAFRGLKSVNVPSGNTLGFRGVNWKGISSVGNVPNSVSNPTDATPTVLYSNEWDRIVYTDAKVPITGGGSIYVCNTVPEHSMTAIICSSNNTATGRAWAEVDTVGTGNQLLFNDGANWAGTVIVNSRMGLINTNESIRAARVTFAQLQFDEPLKIRLWHDAQGITNDCVKITSNSFTPIAGCIDPTPMNGYLPAVGDTFVIAELPAGVKSMSGRTYLANNRWLLEDETGTDGIRRLKARYVPGGVLLNFRGAVPNPQ